MTSNVVKKRSNSDLGQRLTSGLTSSRSRGVQKAIERKLMPLAIAVTAGILTIAPAAIAQASLNPAGGRTTTDATLQRSTCAADTQGLMCNASNRELQADVAPVQAPQEGTASLLQPLSNAQMERLADILLGLLYFVLPTGFGVALFLHDRQQAQRAAALQAQIRLLEKLWEQTPQA